MAMSQIDKQFGKGSIMRMGETTHMEVESIPTGALALDLALGIGGLPRGRVVELYGPEASGKSSLAMHVVAEAQRNGGICAYIDAEHAMDPTYAAAIGVNVDELLISQPDTGEQALEIADMLVRSGALDVVVIDSVAALTPRAEIEGEMGDSHVGLQARLMSQALRKLTANLNRTKTIAIFINQLREKIGISYGNPEVTPGGRALKFYSSVRLDIRRIESIKDGMEIIGNRTRVKVVKNKCLAAGTKVFDPTTGLTHAIEDIVERQEATTVVAADKLGKLHVRPITARIDQGEQEVIGLSFRDGTQLFVTPDHKVLTDRGWKEAGHLRLGDAVARPRRAGGFGDEEPVPPAHARMLGYLIGDGYVGGKTPCAFINTQESLQRDAAEIASSLGCDAHPDGIETSFSHRKGEKNGLLALVRWAGIWGHLAPTKRIPPAFFAADVSADVVSNLLFGIWESDGYVSREQTGALRCGFCTTSEQLARQIHWLLLRWGIASSVRVHKPNAQRPSIVKGRRIQGKLPCWNVRISGIDNVCRFADALPMWGPRGTVLSAELTKVDLPKHRGSQQVYVPESQTEPIIAYVKGLGLTPAYVGKLMGRSVRSGGSFKQALGGRRARRDRLQKLADALESEYLYGVLEEDLWYDRVKVISPPEWRPVYDIEVDDLHTFIANDLVVSNCSAPFKQAEFDIMYGKGISREGSLLDVGVDLGLVKKSGAWYTYEGEQLGQGRENVKQFLADNPEIMVEISERIRQAVGLGEKDGDDPGAGGEGDDDVASPGGSAVATNGAAAAAGPPSG
jgi:recombination protein RecA